MQPPSPDLAILRWLARRDHATAPAIGTACAMVPGEIRARLSALESRRLVASRSEKDAAGSSRRAFYVTGEGKRAAGISDARPTT